jgi:hypothetical protein
MRMLPTRYVGKAEPIRIKKKGAQIAHFSAPLKGLDLTTQLSGNSGSSDRLTAPILKNFNIYEDRIQNRSGTRILSHHADAKPIETIIPFYGVPSSMLVATNGELCHSSDMTLLIDGFTGNDWSWTSFSNLGEEDYTLMANGRDGVWSWNGSGLPVKEVITAPVSEAWFDADDVNIIITHMNRVWMADNNNLVVAYLPLQQKNGEVKFLPLNAIFKRGGSIRAMYTWSIDGGAGLDDKIVIFTSNGECAIYGGTDPDSDWSLVGIFRFDSPMSKHCVINFGGDLYILTSTGLLPMSTVIRAEMEQLGQYDKNVVSAFRNIAMPQRNIPGWSVVLDHGNGRVVCNLPKGYQNVYTQLVRNMADPAWVEWSNVKSRCWCWFQDKLWFGDDSGNFWAMDRTLLNDNGSPILVDVQWSWSDFGTPSGKQFKMVRPYIITDGQPAPFVDIRVDYDQTPAQNQPDATFSVVGTDWDSGEWDVSDWSSGTITYAAWNGVAGYGRVAAGRISASINNCTFAISGIDIIYEAGSIF